MLFWKKRKRKLMAILKITWLHFLNFSFGKGYGYRKLQQWYKSTPTLASLRSNSKRTIILKRKQSILAWASSNRYVRGSGYLCPAVVHKHWAVKLGPEVLLGCSEWRAMLILMLPTSMHETSSPGLVSWSSQHVQTWDSHFMTLSQVNLGWSEVEHNPPWQSP